MPYVEGGSLRDRLSRDGPLPVPERRAAGARGRVGARLRPRARRHSPRHQAREHPAVRSAATRCSRISASPTPSRTGGGQASAQRLTETGVTLGTPAYMSPEQSAGDEVVDARSDIYSLGTVIWEMLAGRPPFEGPNARAIMSRRLTEAPPSLAPLRPDVPEFVDRAMTRALARRPEDRFESAEAFAETLAPGAPVLSRRAAARGAGGRRAAGPPSPDARDRAGRYAAGRRRASRGLLRSRRAAPAADGPAGGGGAAVQEPGRTGRPVLRRRADRGDHQPAGGALGAPGDQPDQRGPVPDERAVGADDRGGAGRGVRAGGERAVGAGRGGGGAAAGDAAADPGERTTATCGRRRTRRRWGRCSGCSRRSRSR